MSIVVTMDAAGRLTLPEEALRASGIHAGEDLMLEVTSVGLLLKPSVEIYTEERLAEFEAAEQELGAVMT